MSTKRIVIVLLVVLIIVNLLLTLKIFSQRKEHSEELVQLDNRVSYQLKVSEDVLDAFLIQFETSEYSLNKEVSLVNDRKQLITFKQLVANQPYKVIFRIFQGNCDSCIESELLDLIELSKKVGSDKIAVISNYNENERMWIKEKFKMDFEFLNLSNDKLNLGIPIDTMNIPYYFVCKDGNTPTKIFPIVGKLQNHTKIFYDEVAKLIEHAN